MVIGAHRRSLPQIARRGPGPGAEPPGPQRYGRVVARYTEPDFAPWDGRRVPITFLGGYLGAGKTTLLNRLLERTERRIAVMVNDVGAVNVDAALIRKRSSNSIELTGGCVCCSLADGFGAAFDGLRSRPEPPDHVVIELSGLAEPERLRPWGQSAGFRLDGVIVLVDLDGIVELRSSPGRGAAIDGQIRTADLVIGTKADLLAPSVVEQRLDLVASLTTTGTPILDSVDGVALAGLLELGGRDDERAPMPTPSLFDAHEVTTIDPGHPTVAELRARLAGDPTLVRAKGIVETVDVGRVLVQQVGRRIEIEPLPAAEWQEPTELALIRLR